MGVNSIGLWPNDKDISTELPAGDMEGELILYWVNFISRLNSVLIEYVSL